MRIELTYPAWKAGVLPLNYTRVISDTIGILSYNFIKCKNFFKFFRDSSAVELTGRENHARMIFRAGCSMS